MKENVLKTFIRDTYKTSSVIPYIITGQVIMFVIIHLLELVSTTTLTNSNIIQHSVSFLSLPKNWFEFINKPWTLLTHPFVYQGLFNLLFDCLWLYWIGNLFLSFLNNRQFLALFAGSIFLGAIGYVTLGSFDRIGQDSNLYNTARFGLAALISSLAILIPNTQIQLVLFGNVRLKFIAMIYLGLEFGFLMIQDKVAAIVYFFMVILGLTYMSQLRKGNDWSKIFIKKKTNLKVIKNDTTISYNTTTVRHKADFENQEIIDQILDKISLDGYESLSSHEKEILFKASKQNK